ncbi:MAG TPA: hypothetical protein VKM93_13650 [Terriglobia bacterium]|nr:hypothetical protein [Terriglobia bacterium]
MTGQDRRQRERLVLSALCQGTPQGPVKESARGILAHYRWREPLHQIVYHVLLAMPFDSPELARQQLPARLTRAGFPDVEVDDLFRPHSLSQAAAEELMHDLAGSSQ